jgi:RND family efflux transporter MFP subunit
LIEIDYVFGITRNYPNQTIAYQAFNDSVREGMVRSQHRALIQNLSNLQTDYRSERDTLSTTKVNQYLNKTQSLSRQFNEIFELITIVFSTSNDSSKVPQTLINSSQATLQSLETQILNANSNLSNALQSIDRAELDLRNTKIDINNDLAASELNLNNTLANLNNDLKSAELKISNAEKTVNKSNISKQTSLNIQYAQYEQSKLRVEKALYNVSLATLVAPRDGTIIRLNGSVGESLKADSIDPENAFIRIVSDANFTTEVYVEEIDIAQINIGQKSIITLDALPDVELEGQVSFISSIAEIDNNGIVTYLVRIDITDAKDQPIREGMTTFVDFITGEALDAIVIPNSALIRDRMVMLENGETVQVETGFTDGDLIEIKSGLSAGDKIVSNPQVEGGQIAGTGGAARGTAGGNLSEERLEQMKAAGFTDDELTKLQAGEISDAMRTKMQSMRENAGGTGNALGGGAPTRGAGGGGGGGRQ